MHTENSPNHESAVGLSIPAHAASKHYTDFTILAAEIWRSVLRDCLHRLSPARPGIALRIGSVQASRYAGEVRPLGTLFIGGATVLWGRFWAVASMANWVLGSRSHVWTVVIVKNNIKE